MLGAWIKGKLQPAARQMCHGDASQCGHRGQHALPQGAWSMSVQP